MATDVEAGHPVVGGNGAGMPATKAGPGGAHRRGLMGRGFMNKRYNNIENQADYTSAMGPLAVVDALIILFFYISIANQPRAGGNLAGGGGNLISDTNGAVSKGYTALSGLGFSFAVAALAVAVAAFFNTGKHVVRGAYIFWASFFTAISIMCAVASLCLIYRLTNAHNFRLFVCVVTIPAGVIGLICFWVSLFTMCRPRRRGTAAATPGTY